jgi:PKHD-type hydroxylase
MALEPAECNRIIDTARMVDPRLSSYGSYHPLLGGLDADLWESLIARVKAANERWWRLDVDEWHVAAKRYRTGEEHAAHQDWIPGHSATKKIVAAWQLSPADYYYGGNVVVTAREHRKTVPREQGSVYILPSWTTHEVEPITVGERWSLLVNAYGPALR